MGTLEQTECHECGQIVHYQAQRWKSQVVCSHCQTSFAVEAVQPPPAVPSTEQSPIPSHLQNSAEPEPLNVPVESEAGTNETYRYQRSKISGIISGGILVAVLSVAVVGGVWGLAMLDNQNAENRKVKKQKEREAAKKINYTDASKNKWAKLGDLEVKVDLVEYGPIRVKDQKNKVHVSSDPLLQIFIKIRSRSPRTVNYVSWYGNSFQSNGSQVVAQLSNQDATVFNMPVFGDVKGLDGHTPEAVLQKNDIVKDCIVFELPEGTKVTDIKELKLSLPMECFGKNGTLYFKFPGEFIQLVMDEGDDE